MITEIYISLSSYIIDDPIQTITVIHHDFQTTSCRFSHGQNTVKWTIMKAASDQCVITCQNDVTADLKW